MLLVEPTSKCCLASGGAPQPRATCHAEDREQGTSLPLLRQAAMHANPSEEESRPSFLLEPPIQQAKKTPGRP